MDNASSAPGASLIPDGTELITTAHLVILAVLAVLTILAILYGARLKRKRTVAEQELEEYNEEVEHKQDASPRAQEAQPLPTPSIAPAPADPAPPRLADEPVAATAPGDASPAAEAQPAAAADSENPADGPVTQLKGLGPKLAAALAAQGITTVGQIAALDDDQARALDARLGPFAGRMARDRWIEQSRFLAAGDRKGFEAVFGRL